MRDLSHELASVPIIIASLNADNTPAALDMFGFGSGMIEIGVGVGGITFDATNKVEFKVTWSDDNSTYTAVTDADVAITLPDGTAGTVGSGGIVRSLTAAHAAATVTRVGLRRKARYWKLLADFSGTHGTATPLACILVKGDAHVSAR